MNSRKLLSAVCHGSVWFSSILLGVGVPLVILLISEDSVVKDNAKEAINVHINLIACYIVFGALAFILIGLPFLALAGLYNLIMPLIAICAVASHPDESYRYPFTFHILNSRKEDKLLPPASST